LDAGGGWLYVRWFARGGRKFKDAGSEYIDVVAESGGTAYKSDVDGIGWL
jgi:hypothetical protein